jgi:mannose-1-phosphate guanylyltransferase
MADGSRARSTRCGIVLAGGAGQRLRSFVYRLRGDTLPKQYVRFTGSCSLLEQTFDRVERVIPPERVFTVAGCSHLQFPEVRDQLAGRSPGTVILQPENRETAPGVLLPLVYLHARFPDAVIGVFPSDHFIDREGLFMGYVDLAFRAVEADPARLVLLGVEPDRVEPEYGYIVPVPGAPSRSGAGVRSVLAFVEKPAPESAGDLAERGGLWNTMVMVFRPKTVMDVVARVAPALHRAFQRVRRAIGTPGEERVVEEVYRDLAPANFSQTVLAAMPGRRSPSLVVLPVRGLFWSDWGSEQRIANALTRTVEAPAPTREPPSDAVRAKAV